MTRVNLTAFRVGLLSTFCVVLLYLWTSQFTFPRSLEAKALDLRFHLRGVKNPTPEVVLVVIDDRSIAELGRWPWSRRRFAEMVQRLQQARAKVIAFDLLLTEPEADIERQVMQRWRQAVEASDLAVPGLTREALAQFLSQLEQTADPDLSLAMALHEAGNVALAFAVVPGPAYPALHVEQPSPPLAISRAAYRVLHNLGTEPPHLTLIGRAIMAPVGAVAGEAMTLGHVNVAFDADGAPRYDYPVAAYAGEYYPSLAVQVARAFLGLAPEQMRVVFGEGIQLGRIRIPTDESMRLLVNYLGPRGTFPTYTFADVLQGRVPDSAFAGAIVLIGAVASGLGDTFITPFEAALPGVERHATVVDNILRQDFLHRRDMTALLDLACVVGLGLVVGWLSSACPTFWGSFAAVGVGACYLTANILAFMWAGLWVNLLFPLLAVALGQSSVTLFRFLTEERQKRMIRQAFQHYLHPAVVEQVSQNPQLLKLGGESRELTVLFSDIRGFSAIAEACPPESLVRLLNEYFTVMTQVVFRHQGLLDKYIGDGIMAVYGAPLRDPEHAYRACHTALDMMGALDTLRAQWKARGLPSLNIGIGINTATMVVGNMGSDLRFDYTVMGDGVNLASRLEGANKEYGTNILISEATWNQVKDRLATRELDRIRVRGKAQQTRIFEVLGWHPLPEDRAALVRLFELGLQDYRAGHWENALQFFQRTLEIAPGDPPSQLYVLRCKTFIRTPPPNHWDGTYNLEMK
jgi:adenylate cyclase